MKVAYLSIGLLALLNPLAAAWSKEDREIFRIRDEIAAHETDPSATFYDILGVKKSASHEDITKAYRQKTRSLHPDKVTQTLRANRAKAAGKGKGTKSGSKEAKQPSQAEINAAVKQASERQARLSLIANILRGPERDRYNHFLSNGFPLWKGTDYYYSRYRPGLGTVVTGVFLLCGGGVHYLILYMSWKRQTEFVQRYIKFARDTAWGGNLSIPGVDASAAAATPASNDDEDGPQQPLNRRQRRMQVKESKREDGRGAGKKGRKAKGSSTPEEPPTGPTGARKRVVAENGKVLVVDSIGDVYLEDQDEEGNVNEFLLDPNEMSKPTFADTAIVRVPLWAFQSTVGRLLGRQAADTYDIIVDDQDSEAAQRTPSIDSAGEDFEILDKSTESLNGASKATGAQQGGKPNKRKGKKR